jgi:hypothetical protein
MRHPRYRPFARASLMVWSLPDAVLEDRRLLEGQFADLVRTGFDGVVAFVRCSRYSWNDAPARAALAWISRACQEAGLDCWIVPDPRLVSRQLIGENGGLEVLMFGDAARAAIVPHCAPVENGRFSVRCSLPPRHVHMLTEVAVEFVPLGLARVYGVRRARRVLGSEDVVDLTASSHLFYNARDRYVEAFGQAVELGGEDWEVVAFFHVRTNHVDFSSPNQMAQYEEMLTRLAHAGVTPSGVLWDEPGFTCTFGTLPYSPSHRRAYRRATGAALERGLWKLAFDAEDGSHLPVRCAYYRVLRESVVRAQSRMQRRGRALWGRTTVSGMHDTWHFESADMCDMNHGSLSKSAGFVDLGGIDVLREPSSPWYAHLAAMNVIAASLGKFSSDRCAYNNLWTVGDDNGAGWQRAVMEYCVSTLGLFGIRWLAHAYGPVGTIGQERSFLGSPPLPGSPDHSTWPGYPGWNRRLREHCAAVEDRLPRSNLLLLFPVETLYGLADGRADRVALEVFQLILDLLDAGFHLDVLSPRFAARGKWGRRGFALQDQRYEAVLYPHARIVPEDHASLFRGAGERLLVALDHPRVTERGRAIRLPEYRLVAAREQIGSVLGSFSGLRPVRAPQNAWATWTEIAEGVVVSLAPARYGLEISGRLGYRGRASEIPPTTGLIRVMFPHDGDVRIL